jgi:hypothetical protein
MAYPLRPQADLGRRGERYFIYALVGTLASGATAPWS